MATAVTLNGVSYSIPANREPRGSWGVSLSSYLVAISTATLQKSGGNFTLTADVNFGATYGLVSAYFKSRTASISTTGVMRFANNEGAGWRNAANGADKILKVNASDRLEYDGVAVPTISSTDTMSNKTFVAPALGTPASGLLTNATGLPLTTGVTGTLPVGNGGTGTTTSTGTGNVVLSSSPTLVTPVLGTPASGTMTNVTGLPLTTGVTGTLPVLNGGTGVTTSTGSGNNVLSTSPVLVTPNLGTPSAAVLTSATGLPLTTGVTGTLPIANGGTGQTGANAALNALLPTQTSQGGKALVTDGSNTSWTTVATAAAATPTALGLTSSYFATVQSAVKTVSSADYTVLTTDGYSVVIVTTGASNRTITLPAAASNTGRILTVKKVDSGAGQVIIDANSSETIDGALTSKLFLQYETATIACDGTSWHVVEYCENSAWRSYTPTFAGFGTVTSIATYWKRSGSDVIIRGSFLPGTVSAVTAKMSLPTGVTVNTTVVASTSLLGLGAVSNTTGTREVTALNINGDTANIGFSVMGDSGSINPLTPQTGSGGFNSTVSIYFAEIRVPVSEWV